jgi:hypothetical protein
MPDRSLAGNFISMIGIRKKRKFISLCKEGKYA